MYLFVSFKQTRIATIAVKIKLLSMFASKQKSKLYREFFRKKTTLRLVVTEDFLKCKNIIIVRNIIGQFKFDNGIMKNAQYCSWNKSRGYNFLDTTQP